MEGAPKNEQPVPAVEGIEHEASIEAAQDLYDQLRVHHDTEVVGKAAGQDVEQIALRLTEILKTIPREKRLEAGLPWHPYDELVAANDDHFAEAA